jgi:hypothetical protein
MFTTTTRTERTILAAAAATVAALGLTVLTTAFVPADPHVSIARQQAILDRVERLQDIRLMQEGRFKTAAVAITLR